MFLSAPNCGISDTSLLIASERCAVITGAMQTERWIPLLKGKSVALVANHTSLIGDVHLVDTMIAAGIDLRLVFSPEHGFRGDADAGAHIKDGIDYRTGISIISLYGKKKKPVPEDLAGIDVVVFDIQDVGARFYTYLSTMTLVMEACAEAGIPFVVFDRPNPNIFYIDGPVLKPGFESFVGMHPVPVVHGMTPGEYALMVNGEQWLSGHVQANLTVIELKNYNRNTLYQLPVRPSPNLPDMISVYLYPSLCFFEGTFMSVGRGTSKPFRLIGHPDYHAGNISFTPVTIPGAATNPPHRDVLCYGFDFSFLADSILINKRLYLQPLIDAGRFFEYRPDFFNRFFDRLAGTDQLRKQILAGLSEYQIRKGWQPDLDRFRKMRKAYLLYD